MAPPAGVLLQRKAFWNGRIEGSINCMSDSGLGLPSSSLCIVDGFGVASGLGIEANGMVWARIGSINPRCGQFQGIFCGLLCQATETPFLQLCGLESFKTFKEDMLEGLYVGM